MRIERDESLIQWVGHVIKNRTWGTKFRHGSPQEHEITNPWYTRYYVHNIYDLFSSAGASSAAASLGLLSAAGSSVLFFMYSS